MRRSRLVQFIFVSTLIHLTLIALPRSFFDPIFPRTSVAIVPGKTAGAPIEPDFEVINLRLEVRSEPISSNLSQEEAKSESTQAGDSPQSSEPKKIPSSASQGEAVYFPPVPTYVVMPSVKDLKDGTLSVVLEILVDENGKPKEVNLPDTLHSSRLRENLEHSAMLFRFKPATKGGVPISAWVRLPISIKAGGRN